MKIFFYVAMLLINGIQLKSLVSASTSGSSLSLRRHLQLSNDDCAGATPIFLHKGKATLTGETNVGSLNEDISLEGCGTQITRGVWYKFAVQGPKRITVSTCNQADFDTKITVFKGNCQDLTCLIGVDDTYERGCFGFTTEVEVAAKHVEIYVLVHGFVGYTGTFNLTVTTENAKQCSETSNKLIHLMKSNSKNCQQEAHSFCQDALVCSGTGQGENTGDCIKSICKGFHGTCEANCDLGYAAHPYTGEYLCYCDAYCIERGDCCDDQQEFCPIPTSCNENCDAYQSVIDIDGRLCSCDIYCTERGDCCADKEEFCPAPTSCQDNCDGIALDPSTDELCYCDVYCIERSDCCVDKEDFCPVPTSCQDNCYGVALDPSTDQLCSCYDYCIFDGNCCDDKETFCPTPTSCQYNCYGIAIDPTTFEICSCSEYCIYDGNCCEDIADYCPVIQLPTSCEDNCYGDAIDPSTGAICYCNEYCIFYDNCCEDKEEFCPTPTSCQNNCYGVAIDPATGAACSCSEYCAYDGNCCGDIADYCPVIQLPTSCQDNCYGVAVDPTSGEVCDCDPRCPLLELMDWNYRPCCYDVELECPLPTSCEGNCYFEGTGGAQNPTTGEICFCASQDYLIEYGAGEGELETCADFDDFCTA